MLETVSLNTVFRHNDNVYLGTVELTLTREQLVRCGLRCKYTSDTSMVVIAAETVGMAISMPLADGL